MIQRLQTKLDIQAFRDFLAARPFEGALYLAMVAGLIVALLFSIGYGIGKDRALADNRASQTQDGR